MAGPDNVINNCWVWYLCRDLSVSNCFINITNICRAEETLKIEITKDNLPLGCNVRHIDGRSVDEFLTYFKFEHVMEMIRTNQ